MVRLRPVHLGPGAWACSTFQSHYGAIATEPDVTETYKEHGGFNPTMVRLRLFQPLLPTLQHMLFQSHYGAIATKSVMDFVLSIFRFNPTMVRLRPAGLIVVGLVISAFQSHYGAIATNILL